MGNSMIDIDAIINSRQTHAPFFGFFNKINALACLVKRYSFAGNLYAGADGLQLLIMDFHSQSTYSQSRRLA